MKRNVLWFMFIFTLCCLSGCDFGNPFLDVLLYTVTFDVDGGEPEISSVSCVPGENVALPGSNPTKQGYVFGGWYMQKDGGGQEFTGSMPINADTRVYARWIEEGEAVKITFDADGGAPVPAPIVRAKGETVSSLPSPAKDRHVFDGWYTEKEGGGTQFTTLTVVTGDLTVYAKWTPHSYVTCNADGGRPANTIVSCPVGSTVQLPSDPTRTGYTFKGWYTEQDGGGTQFTASTPVNEDITVYAKWEPYPQVTFDADGGSPAKTTKTCPPGSTVRLPGAPTRTEYSFDGWYTEKEGRGRKFTSSTQVNADITVYAKWKPYPRVTFDTDDGVPPIIKICAPGDKVAPPSDPVRTGYVFYGWYTEKNGGGQEFTSSMLITRDRTIYARWIEESRVHTVTFDVDGGKPAPTPIKCIEGEGLDELFPDDPKKDDHTFEGWYTESNGAGQEFTATSVVSKSITVYAWWKPYPVVTFNTNDGAPTETTAICAPGDSVALPSPNPTRAGYVFIGWYTEKDGSGKQFTASTVVTEDVKVYAKWLPYLTVNGILESGVSRIRFPNSSGMSLRKGSALAVVLSGSGLDWSGAKWEIKVDAQPVSITGSGASRIWEVPANTMNGQYTVTVMVWIGSSLYVGNFPILITN